MTDDDEGVGYGFGWFIRDDDAGRRLLYHSGGSVGGTSLMIMQPDTGVVVVGLVNEGRATWMSFATCWRASSRRPGSGERASTTARLARPLTQEEMFRRNVGSREQQRTPFPPHKIVGNLYYVGSESLASFLVATPEGHILINTNWEDAVDGLRGSVEALGFEFTDIEIILGSHAHGDHMQGDARVKELSGGQVMAMAQDVPALERMRPGDKPHPIDRVPGTARR